MREDGERAKSSFPSFIALIAAAVLAFSTCCAFTWLPGLILTVVLIFKLRAACRPLVLIALAYCVVRALATVSLYYCFFVHPADPGKCPLKTFIQLVPYGGSGEPGFFQSQIRSRNEHVKRELQQLSTQRQELTEDFLRSTKDPYAKSPYRLMDASPSVWVYSVGPDRLDQNGKILYDPTNGLVSIGDIWVEGDEQLPPPEGGV